MAVGTRMRSLFRGCSANFGHFLAIRREHIFRWVCLGVVYARISRVNQRATTIVSQYKAVVKFGRILLCFQVCECATNS